MKYYPLILLYIAWNCVPPSDGSVILQNVSSISITESDNDAEISLNSTATVTTETTASPVKQPLTGTTRTVAASVTSYTITVENQSENVMPHRMPTQLEEKVESLSCNLPLLPTESRLWNGNETHELLLPITVYPDCSISKSTEQPASEVSTECPSVLIKWEGEIEIQSGDVLLVRIDDSQLIHGSDACNESDIDQNTERALHEPTTAVYQVTRTGHDNCDKTEGVLLDINPLKVDNQKVVTLYDKDLTEGINLLIVVSELWKNQCIRLKVVVKSDNCGDNEDCSGKGICYSNVSMEGYECQCCPGFVGPHCEEQDACYPSPCENNGICVDISQGHEGSTFQCLCPYGYTGKTCREETDSCTSMPCQNGATCTGNVTQFKCECPRGFSGPQCQHNLNECDSSPCIHGICVDQEDGYKCYCQPGFTGTHCEYEYNECESSPCLNGGTCTDHIGSYSCTCGRGFTGKRCHIKACSTNPCTNGGTCWSSVDSFYCACRPGYTGKTCEDEFVVETITNVDPINKDGEIGLQVPLSVHLNHLHNVYIAAGTLACAFIIVALIVTVCHCRVNKTYERFPWIKFPFWARRARRAAPQPSTSGNSVSFSSEWFTGKNKASTATPSRNLPSLDTSDMYYTLDFSDSQSSPLIQ
ncbi:hypothetical protein Trydic_g21917 [Trypoxylus dichotomus]